MLRSTQAIASLFVVLLFISKQLHANEDLFSLSLGELMQMEISGASFSGDTLSSVPASVTVFTAKEIQQLGIHYLHELTNFVPGFQSKRQGDSPHVYSYSARGRQVGSATRSVKLIVNGQAWSSPYAESTMVSVPMIPVFNISKVEFVRGPGSVLHGSGAMMASINVETYQNDDYVDINIGHWSHMAHAINYAKKGWYLSAYGESNEGDDYRLKNMDNAEFIPAKDALNSNHFYLSKTQGDLNIALSHHYVESQGYYSFSRVNEDFNSRQLRFMSLSADYQLINDDYTDLKLHVFTNRNTVKYSSDLTGYGALSAISNPSVNDSSWVNLHAQANQYGIRLIADWLQPHGNLTLGAEYIYDEPVRNSVNSNFDLPALSNQQFPIGSSTGEPYTFKVFEEKENQKVSLFSEYEYRLTEYINSIYSLRYDYAKRVDKYSLSPRLAFVYTPKNYLSFKLLYSEAFRTPDNIELGTTNNPTVIGNEDLIPETIQTSEFIMMLQDSKQSFSASYYYNHIEDGIEQVSVGGPRQFLNTGTSYNDGLELEYKIELSDGIKFNMTYSQQFSELEASFRLSQRHGSASLFLQHNKWAGSLSSFYHSGSELVFGSDLMPIEDFWHHNASITYLHSEKFESSLSATNLSNRQYKTAGPSSNLDVGVPAQGRFTSYTLKMRF